MMKFFLFVFTYFSLITSVFSTVLTADENNELQEKFQNSVTSTLQLGFVVSFPICDPLSYQLADKDVVLNVPFHVEYTLDITGSKISTTDDITMFSLPETSLTLDGLPTAYTRSLLARHQIPKRNTDLVIAEFKKQSQKVIDNINDFLIKRVIIPHQKSETLKLISYLLIKDFHNKSDFVFEHELENGLSPHTLINPLCASKSAKFTHFDLHSRNLKYGKGFEVERKEIADNSDKNYLFDDQKKLLAFNYKQEITNQKIAVIDIEIQSQTEESYSDQLSESISDGEKIINGKSVTNPESWMVVFVNKINGKFSLICGGTLYKNGWVITAAHCNINDDTYAIINRLEINGAGGKIFEIDFTWKHSKFRSIAPFNFDIALVKLVGDVPFSGLKIIPEEITTGDEITVFGWGETELHNGFSENLRRVNLEVFRQSTCEHRYKKTSTKVTNNMFCAAKFGKDSCKGDSGGAAIYKNQSTDKVYLSGIVSFGRDKCADSRFPGVYTNVYLFSDWINEVINQIDKEKTLE